MDTPLFTGQRTKANTILEAIYERRAVRRYKPRPVAADLIEQLLDAGRMAPSAMNRQPWKFYVLTKEEDIRLFSQETRHDLVSVLPKIEIKDLIKDASKNLRDLSLETEFIQEEDPVFHGAPVVIFITATKDNDAAKLDVGMCAQNIMLAAKSLGLDTCPIGFGKLVMEANSYPKLNVGQDEEILITIALGYGAESPMVHPRKKDNATYL